MGGGDARGRTTQAKQAIAGQAQAVGSRRGSHAQLVPGMLEKHRRRESPSRKDTEDPMVSPGLLHQTKKEQKHRSAQATAADETATSGPSRGQVLSGFVNLEDPNSVAHGAASRFQQYRE